MTPSISFVSLRSAIRGGEPQAAGLAATSAGLSRIFSDDHEMLELRDGDV